MAGSQLVTACLLALVLPLCMAVSPFEDTFLVPMRANNAGQQQKQGRAVQPNGVPIQPPQGSQCNAQQKGQASKCPTTCHDFVFDPTRAGCGVGSTGKDESELKGVQCESKDDCQAKCCKKLPVITNCDYYWRIKGCPAGNTRYLFQFASQQCDRDSADGCAQLCCAGGTNTCGEWLKFGGHCPAGQQLKPQGKGNTACEGHKCPFECCAKCDGLTNECKPQQHTCQHFVKANRCPGSASPLQHKQGHACRSKQECHSVCCSASSGGKEADGSGNDGSKAEETEKDEDSSSEGGTEGEVQAESNSESSEAANSASGDSAGASEAASSEAGASVAAPGKESGQVDKLESKGSSAEKEGEEGQDSASGTESSLSAENAASETASEGASEAASETSEAASETSEAQAEDSAEESEADGSTETVASEAEDAEDADSEEAAAGRR